MIEPGQLARMLPSSTPGNAMVYTLWREPGFLGPSVGLINDRWHFLALARQTAWVLMSEKHDVRRCMDFVRIFAQDCRTQLWITGWVEEKHVRPA